MGRETTLERRFDNLIIGTNYQLSFQFAIITYQKPPASFEICLGDQSVFTDLPKSNDWQQQITSYIRADSTSLNLKFIMTGVPTTIPYYQGVITTYDGQVGLIGIMIIGMCLYACIYLCAFISIRVH
jgi:hypothetical protein